MLSTNLKYDNKTIGQLMPQVYANSAAMFFYFFTFDELLDRVFVRKFFKKNCAATVVLIVHYKIKYTNMVTHILALALTLDLPPTFCSNHDPTRKLRLGTNLHI